MAKVKSAGLRNYIGRLGGNVYYLNNGQQVSRELAAQVSNPRTPAQMRQRMKWANIVNVYKANKDWMGHLSFENKPSTWSDYNAFMSANIGRNPVYMTKNLQETGGVILAPYTMTSGSLATVAYEWAASVDGVITNLHLDVEADTATIGTLSESLIRLNSDWRTGDQLSIIIMYRDHMYRPIVVPIEIILDENDTTPVQEIEYQFANLNDIILTEDGYLAVHGKAGVVFGDVAICVVHSRTISGRTSVSTQAYELNFEATITFLDAGSNEAFNAAAESYGLGEEYFLATGYQAGQTDIILRSFTGYAQNDQSINIPFTIVPNGTNNILEASAGAQDENTYVSLYLNVSMIPGQTYSLYFTPTTGSTHMLLASTTIVAARLANFSISRGNVTDIVSQGGTYQLVMGAAWGTNVVVEIPVTAV